MAPGRKHPFSGKAKKQQLKEKKTKIHGKITGKKPTSFLKRNSDDDSEVSESEKLNQQPTSSNMRNKGRNVNRYALHFYKETKAEIEANKLAAHQSLKKLPEEDLEIDFRNYFPPELDFPRRPPWNFDMSREELNARENRYFTEFVNKVKKEFEFKNLSHFELNLETWRQLWRVLEMSDIILITVDIRFAAMMFPPSIYKYVCEELKKYMILVLNKIDLAPPDLIVAWKHYFLEHYPTLKIVTFTSFPSYNLRNDTENRTGMQVRRRKCKLQMAAEGAQKLYDACKEITQGQVDLTSWHEKITEEMKNVYDDAETEIKIDVTDAVDTGYHEHVPYREGTLTIGCIGQPNVGKSSLINAIMGKKVVSVSRTPGHTKHFQTIYLTKNVILCDCPGLVFPSKISRTLQILIGSYPIAQVREPYGAVRYLAERLDLPNTLRIQHPENDDTWSAIDICDGWARKRGFFTAKAARLDTYRAANNILRMQLEGKICLRFAPPGYHANREKWLNHPDVSEVAWIQARAKQKTEEIESENSYSEEEEEEENVGDENFNNVSRNSSGENSLEPLVTNRFQLLGRNSD